MLLGQGRELAIIGGTARFQDQTHDGLGGDEELAIGKFRFRFGDDFKGGIG